VSAPHNSEKLQKVLAEYGHGSRREIEKWIAAGRLEVNGEVAHVGQRVVGEDQILLDGKLVGRKTKQQSRVLIYNKPSGMICTRSDPEGRPSVYDALPTIQHGRWISVGRLDIATTGLLLFSNDGELANAMMHPATGLDREYAVRLNGRLTAEQLEQAKKGVLSDNELLSFSDIRYYDGRGDNHWYHVVLMEGKNREVRRLFTALGVPVSRLKRVRFGPVILPSRLKRGRVEEFSTSDTHQLRKILRLPTAKPAGRKGSGRKRKHPSVLIAYPDLHRQGASGKDAQRKS
jgi:23S rRNA pseudouridine2605 synthase